jgi:transposase InsO family protein
MGMSRYLVEAVVLEGRRVEELAKAHGVSRGWIYKLVARYKEGGYEALEPRSRRPKSCPHAAKQEAQEAILAMRAELETAGHDCGPQTIAYHLSQIRGDVPSFATIWRILSRHGHVTPQPQKRPKCSFVRFVADLPNERWQADFTHWQLANGRDVEILNFLDDHSRLVVASRVYRNVKAFSVVETFQMAYGKYGLPASVLTDNGVVFTARFQSGKVLFESELERLGVKAKHSTPYHPQTCGKVERFHQTLKRWLRKQPGARTIPELQQQIDGFIDYYNNIRPHRTLGTTPANAFAARIKAKPDAPLQETYFRIRNDKVDIHGKLTLRHNSKLYHIGIGRAFANRRVKLLIAGCDISVVAEDGEVIRKLILDESRNYQPRSA